MIIINNMNQDLSNDSSLLDSYNTFCSNLATNVSNNLTNLIINSAYVNNSFTNWLQNNLNGILSGSLQYYTYAYETSNLLAWWTANINLISIQLTTDLAPYFLNWINSFQLLNNPNLLTTLIESNFATVISSGSNNYNVNSSLNNNSNLTIANANNNSNLINNNSLGNGTMSQDSTPIKESQAQFNNGISNDLNAVNIANFLLTITNNLKTTFKQQIELWLKPYLLQFNNLDSNERSYNW